MTTLTMPLAEGVYLARAVLPAVSKDDVTPVLTGALWQFTGKVVTAVATDRYRVHRALANAEGDGEVVALIPARALKWIVGNASFFGRVRALIVEPILTVDVRITEDDAAAVAPKGGAIPGPKGQVTLTIAANETDEAERISYTADLIAGNFPPISDLIDKSLARERVAPEGELDLDYVAGTTGLAEYRRERGRIEFVSGGDRKDVGSVMLVIYRRGVAMIQQSRPS